MAATNVESFTNPRDALPNTYQNTILPREIDFVTRFGRNWDALRELMGIMRPIRKAPGTTLSMVKASVALESGAVEPGEVIPYSKTSFTKVAFEDLTIQKYAKAVTIEEVEKYGAAIAVEKSDEAFLNQLQTKVMTDFYTFLNGAADTPDAAGTWQKALAKAKANVLSAFQDDGLAATEVVGFANIMDAYDYLGETDITVQSEFGINYVKNFLGYSTLFLLSDSFIDQGLVIAVPVENIDLYYVDPGDSDFARLGLDYTVQGETNLIGFHAQGAYHTAVGESYALMGMKLWAEYADGISNVYVGTATKVTTAETITAEAAGSLKYKTAHSPLLSVEELKDGNTAITNYTMEKDGVRLASAPSGTVTIKYTYAAQS